MRTLDEVIEIASDWTNGFDEMSIEKQMLYYLKMYRSDQEQWGFFQKNYEDELKQKIKDFGDAKERYIKRLKETYGRPIVNTEWLARCLHNTVQEMFPLFYLEKIGCYNWGFVAGKYQTYEPWEALWQRYEKEPNMDIDFTKWFHDLYRPSHHPYDPREIEIIQRYSRMADEDFSIEKAKREK